MTAAFSLFSNAFYMTLSIIAVFFLALFMASAEPDSLIAYVSFYVCDWFLFV